jgi:hypothetical protein
MSPRFFEVAASEPGVSIRLDPSVPYMPEYPWLFHEGSPIAPLHECVYDFYMGGIRPRKPGEIVHHRDHDKMNATIENLGVGSRSAHALAHSEKRQRFTPRKKWDLFGWFRPQGEAPHRVLGFKEELRYEEQLLARERRLRDTRTQFKTWLKNMRYVEGEKTSSSSSSSSSQSSSTCSSSFSSSPPVSDLQEAEKVLAAALPRLRAELDHLDSGKKIPPPASRPRQRDRLLGIHRIRRGCTPGEAALVRLLVKHAFEIEKVAQEAGVSTDVIKKMSQEPAVALAIQHWHEWRRLPPACSPQKLKRYLHSRESGT